MNRIEIKRIARQQLSAHYASTMFYVYIPAIIIGLASTTFIGGIIAAPLAIGSAIGLLHIYKGNKPDQQALIKGYDSTVLVRNVLQLLLMTIFIVLWSLLFVIPGIIKAYSYAMVPYLLADPDVNEEDVITLSRQMMDGKKMDLFVLQLSFIGLAILGVFTLNILNVLYTIPYLQLSTAGFYLQLKTNNI